MPDKWEYPWYAAWDLAFHCVPIAIVDPDFAKEQLVLLVREWYMHPNGQLPAYEWALGDVNPPVHAWAAWRVYKIDKKRRGAGDRLFLERVFQKLLLNFTWWVNRKDATGANVFEGGFLGLDNIGVFDRSKPLPTGGRIEQSDGTSWMAMYTLNMLAIAMELAHENAAYEDIASKFWEHFIYIARAMTTLGFEGTGLWDEEDGFFHDVLLERVGPAPAAEGALDGRTDPALRGRDARARPARPPAGVQEAPGMVRRAPARPDQQRGVHAHARPGRTAAARDRRSRPPDPHPEGDARRERIPVAVRHPCAVARAPRSSLHPRRRRRRSSRGLRAGRVDQRAVRRQLQLARAGLVSGQLPADRSAAEVPLLFRQRPQGGVPDRVRRPHDACRRSRPRSRSG